MILTEFTKDPNAILDYSINWGDWFASTTEALNASTWTVDTGLTVDSDARTTSIATLWVSGGTVGASYNCENQIETSLGRTDERSIRITIVDK